MKTKRKEAKKVVSSHGYSSKTHPIEIIERRRELPLPGEVLVEPGDEVDPATPVAKIALKPGIPWVVPAARLLGIEAGQLPEAMLKDVGDEVETQEVIAKAKSGRYGQKEYEAPTDGVIEEISEKSGRIVIREEFGKEEPPVEVDVAFEIGCRPRELPENMMVEVDGEVKKGQLLAKKGESGAFFTKTCQAPVSGVVQDVDDRTGIVTIARPFKEVVVDAYITGVVEEIIPERGAVVESPAVVINGVFGVGSETFGPLNVLVDSPEDVLEADMITEENQDQVVVGGSRATNEALEKALDLGVNGVITGTASYLHLINSLDVKLGVGITGQEDIDMTVILMEGFGDLAMTEDAFEALKQLEGRQVSINGRTQIRAGAIRPEIVAPFPELVGEDLTEEEMEVEERLHKDLQVRIISDPYFGAVGKIIDLPTQPVEIETEAKVPVAEVKLNNGNEVIVPRKNVEPY